MNPEEYAQLFRLGESHWWFIGTRDILVSCARNVDLHSKHILDAGCGSGLMMRRIRDAGFVYGIDRNFEALKHCSSLAFTRLCQGDTVALPFKSGSFDLIIAADLLEHCDDDEAALSEFHRALCAGGKLLVSVPAYRALWSAHDVALHHKRRYSRDELVKKAQKHDYCIERATYFNTLLFPPVALARLTMGKLLRKQSKINYHENLKLLNKMLLGVMKIERRLLESNDLPFGLSIALLASKK